MSFGLSDIEGILCMPDGPVSDVISLQDDNLFSQQTPSLGGDWSGLRDSTEDVTTSIERRFETKLFFKIEELLLQHARKENEDLRRLILANTTKVDYIVHLLNDHFNTVVDVRPVVSSPNGRNEMVSGDELGLSFDKDLLNKVDSVFF